MATDANGSDDKWMPRRRSVVAGLAASAIVPTRALMAREAPGEKTMLKTDYKPSDTYFGAPFIDVDEQRQYPRPHRYVHGGFHETKTLFSFYFPEKGLYDGRFAQWMEGGAGGNERSITVHQDRPEPTQWDYLYDMAFDDLNGYLIESNQGHGVFDKSSEPEPGVYTWRASTESARFSRYVAEQIYGKKPHHGYVGGIGGGGGRAIACLENAPDVYQGCAPQIIGSSVSAYSAMQRAILFLGPDRLKEVIDAVEPGGSGDPYATLDAVQRGALADLYRTGYPRGAENQLKHTRTIGFVYTGMEHQDPSYFTDFWTKSGYAGADAPELLKPYIIQTKARVKRVVPMSEAMEPATLAWYAVLSPDAPFAVVLDVDDQERFYGCEMTFVSGEAKGRNLFINGTFHGLSGFPERTPEMMQGVKPGDEVQLDNRRFIAFLHSFLYSIRAPESSRALTGEAINRSGRPFAPDGVPMYPQRPAGFSGGGIKGEFDGKMIYVLSTHDIYVWPVTSEFSDIYTGRYGPAVKDRYRFYWAEHGAIGPPQLAVGYNVGEGDLRVWDTRLIDFQHSMGRYVWRYLKEWAEDGRNPPDSTSYRFSSDNALVLPKEAAQRAGIQPVVSATANGDRRAHVKVGEAVKFEAFVEAPPGAGKIVSAEWDFDQTGAFPVKHPEANGAVTSLHLHTEHAFDRPGTYFVAFRGGTLGNIKDKGLPIHNLDRVRVIVS